MHARLAVEVDGLQVDDVLVAQLAQQQDLADGGRGDALALLARLEGLDSQRARLAAPGARQVHDAVGALPDLVRDVEQGGEVGRRPVASPAALAATAKSKAGFAQNCQPILNEGLYCGIALSTLLRGSEEGCWAGLGCWCSMPRACGTQILRPAAPGKVRYVLEWLYKVYKTEKL